MMRGMEVLNFFGLIRWLPLFNLVPCCYNNLSVIYVHVGHYINQLSKSPYIPMKAEITDIMNE